VTVDYRLRKRLLEGLAIDTRPFTDLHATDQWQGSVSSLSLLLSMVSCFGSVGRISVFGNSRWRVPDWNNAPLASWRIASALPSGLIALVPGSYANVSGKRSRAQLWLEAH